MRFSLIVCCFAATGVCIAQDSPPAKKVIEWGWDEPDTKFIRENVEKMEQMPFDGLIFHVASSKGGTFTWEMWGTRKFALSEFQHSIDNLKATRFRRLADRFLRVNVTPGKVDWFEDEAWAVVLNNFTVAAQVAKQSGCKGFMFDVEQYNEQLFNYGKQKHRNGKTFAEYQAKVRQRGQQWMKAVGGQFPDITILLTFGYSITGGAAKDRAGASYGLLADFLDGMLDAMYAADEARGRLGGGLRLQTERAVPKGIRHDQSEVADVDGGPRQVPPARPGGLRHLDGLSVAAEGVASR